MAAQSDLAPGHLRVLDEHGAFIEMLDVTPMTKSYKMQVLLGMLNAGLFPGRIDVADLVGEVAKLATRTVRPGRTSVTRRGTSRS